MNRHNDIRSLSVKLWDDLGLALLGLAVCGAVLLCSVVVADTTKSMNITLVFMVVGCGVGFVLMIPWIITYATLMEAKRCMEDHDETA